MRFAALSLTFAVVGCGSTPRPTADPGPLQRTARAGEELTFDASASKGSITRYTWDFGDNTDLVEAKTTTHKYAADGDFSATLTVRGPGGAHSASVLVNVGSSCTATAMIDLVTTNPNPGDTVVLGSTGSMGCMGAALTTFEWEFGDGATVMGDSSKATVSHVYPTMGTYMVKLHVVDANGNEGRASRSLGIGVVVSGNPTVQCAVSASTVQTGRMVGFSASGSDPGGLPLTYAWTFSDSSSATGSTVQKTFATIGSYTGTVVATASDSRASMPCSKTVMVTAPVNYTGTWIVSPTGSGNFQGSCPFAVSFPTASLSIFHVTNPDGGPELVTVTPNGGSYPAGSPLAGSEESPGSFLAQSNTPSESPGSCGQSLSTSHSIRLTFSSGTAVTGTWTKQYNGCTSGCLNCNCVAGGSTNGTFSGFKQ